ncbi:sensor histidine kinase [Anaeromicropila herbilytica]|uniref:histidine kinase n=1 Tax=Anaeromicropila herbilytica TaxID=2785025 RepID=A0A7R7EPJ6_9FIRM|nr:HAMP domain-containing sensor histidine kinase [Anaeromicropila herbilytica]BCN32681.1 two-component sensor histidine kinase [Anaeromicropila herbilytica]
MGQGLREGMRKKNGNNKYLRLIKQVAGLLLLILLFDISILKIQYDNYQDKILIICKMMNDKDGLMKASDILKKGQITNTTQGKEILDKYGYKLSGDNELYRRFQVQEIIIVGMSFLFVIILFGIIYALKVTNRKKTLNELRTVEALIEDYKRGVVEQKSYIEPPFQNEELKNLYEEICSLGDTLKLLNERESKEKESTKELVSDISHQLKTPVAALKTSFEILQQDLSAEERIEFTQRCNVQILGIENLLGALINISRMEAGMIEIQLVNQCLFDTMLEAINRVYEKAKEKHIEIEFEAKEELKGIGIPHDKKWLCEAFINLLENAIKYSNQNKKIILSMIKMVTFLRVEICDEGIGIPQEEYNQIFQRFYRGNSAQIRKESGSGIGLYLTREIISRHHGTIRVEPGLNKKGSKFIIQLPYK